MSAHDAPPRNTTAPIVHDPPHNARTRTNRTRDHPVGRRPPRRNRLHYPQDGLDQLFPHPGSPRLVLPRLPHAIFLTLPRLPRPRTGALIGARTPRALRENFGAVARRRHARARIGGKQKSPSLQKLGAVAPATGFEPVTVRLTVGCSAVELRRIATKEDGSRAAYSLATWMRTQAYVAHHRLSASAFHPRYSPQIEFETKTTPASGKQPILRRITTAGVATVSTGKSNHQRGRRRFHARVHSRPYGAHLRP